MPGPFAPRRRLLADILSVLVVYGLVAIGSWIFIRQSLGETPDFASIEGALPLAVLSVLPVALLVVFALRARSLIIDLRSGRYGSRLRARLVLLFLLAVAAASLPQGFFLLRIAKQAQASTAAADIREALSSGKSLALSWYGEELARLERIARSVTAASPTSAAGALATASGIEPRMESVELFRGGRSSDFAGILAARLESLPPLLPRGSSGLPLPSQSSGDSSRLRYAIAWQGAASSIAVFTLRLPTGLESSAELLERASRNASLLAPSSARWGRLLELMYLFLIAPLLILAALLGLAAADLVAEPLQSLEDATRRVARGDYGVRLIVKSGDETGRLVSSFNRMLGEIERYRSDELRKEKIDAWKDIAQRLAHELKNPLTPIRLTAERLLRRWSSDPARAGEIIEASALAIIKEVEGMDALLSDFRSFASLPEPQRDWIALHDIVAEAAAVYVSSYPEVRIETDGVPTGFSLRVDRSALKRALGNLFANSIDAMDGRGVLSVAAELVKAADSRYCRILIRDTGRGIPQSIGDRVFVPYFTTKTTGTGLGLSIVERIVAEHGGSIRFESAEGSGTTFYLDLPLDR